MLYIYIKPERIISPRNSSSTLSLGRAGRASSAFHTPSSSSRPKSIGPFGYHMVGCKIGANAIRLYDEVVAVVAKLFRSLRVDAVVEPTRLFVEVAEDRSSQRSDTFLRDPIGLGTGRQAILDVAVTGIDGQSRAVDEALERPMQVRYE